MTRCCIPTTPEYFRVLRVWQKRQLEWEEEVFNLVVNKVELPLAWSSLPYLYPGDLPSEPSTGNLSTNDNDGDDHGPENGPGGDGNDQKDPDNMDVDDDTDNERQDDSDATNPRPASSSCSENDSSDQPDPPKAGRRRAQPSRRGRGRGDRKSGRAKRTQHETIERKAQRRREAIERKAERRRERTGGQSMLPPRSFLVPPMLDRPTVRRIERWLEEVNPRDPD
ncbi:MAG: hypothetical protein M1823_005940 [Watsoniomyces obsoletus]|nr:MAG: hypothetical protein M1823_005940 [Watsoniomyces obsoletus]